MRVAYERVTLVITYERMGTLAITPELMGSPSIR